MPPKHAHHHHHPPHPPLPLHSPSFTPGRLFWSIVKSAMSSSLNVYIGFLKVIVWQTDGGLRQINKSRSMSSVMCRSDWFLSPAEVSVRPSLCTHSRWILSAHTHTRNTEKKRSVCVWYGRQGGSSRAHILAPEQTHVTQQSEGGYLHVLYIFKNPVYGRYLSLMNVTFISGQYKHLLIDY